MGCNKCHRNNCNNKCFVTRQIKIGTGGDGGSGTGDLDDVAKRGNVTDIPLQAAPANFDEQLATLGQVKEYVQGVTFEYVTPDNNGNLYI